MDFIAGISVLIGRPFLNTALNTCAFLPCLDAIPDGKPLHTFPGIALAGHR
jgi:hypothetical protein